MNEPRREYKEDRQGREDGEGTNRKLLYVDVLNYSNDFGFTLKTWNLGYPIIKIAQFVNAARRSKWDLVIFIDAGIESEEALEKWRSRREEEVKREYRDVPQGLSVLVGDIFLSFGIKVYYSPYSADNDDCIASHANADGADILSNDKDFFRYIDHKYKRYGKFEIVDGYLLLSGGFPPKLKPGVPKPLPRTFIDPPKMLTHNPSFNSVKHLNYYRRGAPSSLVKLLGNPHCLFVGLRSSIYAKMGRTQAVKEEFPEWDHATEFVIWKTIDVEPSHEFDHFLTGDFDNLKRTCEHFISKLKRDVNRVPEREFYNHTFAIYAIIFELWCTYNDNKVMMLQCFKRIFEQALDFDEKIEPLVADVVCRDFVKTGSCKFGEKCFSKTGHKICSDLSEFKYCRRDTLCRFRHTL